jgi:hypothetical protein
MPNPFDPMQLTPRDMMRAAPVLKEQAGLDDVDPYDLLDVTGDRYLRRVLVIWCLKSRDDPTFTWEQAFDTPFGELFDADEEEAEAAGTPPTPGPQSSGSEPGTPSANGVPKKKRRAAAPASNSASTSG